MKKLVGFTGLRGSGKDTAALALVAAGWKRTAFADPLYQETADGYRVPLEFLQNRETKETPLDRLALKNCSDEGFIKSALMTLNIRLDNGNPDESENEDLLSEWRRAMDAPRSPRQVLQWWGTEYRRATCGDDYWRGRLTKLVTENPNENFVVTDVRFPDEANLIKKLGGQVARIVRPNLAGATDAALLHSSEQAMLDYDVEIELINAEGKNGMDAFLASVTKAFLV